MPKRTDLKKILVIGSGPIVIGQAAEFDYAGTQACLALKEEGYQVVLCNSNPATIMTDTTVADKVYMEPLTLEYLAKIIRYERPDAIVPGIGGQTGLNLAMALEEKGVLRECRVELLGTSRDSIARAEDRELFKELCQSLGEPVLPSRIATSVEEALEAAEEIGYPVVLRPAFTLGGTGGGFADDPQQLKALMKTALELSPVHQVLVEKSIRGFKEIEYEVMRDHNDTAITICNMENLDPVGIHTGDSIVVCPSQTLTNKEYQMLRNSALKIIRALKIAGGCNVQFALDPKSFQYYLIEVNPRVSRSSALASKASGYPIARVSAKICVGMNLEEIPLANTSAAFEPTLDYVVTKMPRFPFDKFADADNHLSTQMKATGEVMSVGRTFEESLLKPSVLWKSEPTICTFPNLTPGAGRHCLTMWPSARTTGFLPLPSCCAWAVPRRRLGRSQKSTPSSWTSFKKLFSRSAPFSQSPRLWKLCTRPSAWALETKLSPGCGIQGRRRSSPCGKGPESCRCSR